MGLLHIRAVLPVMREQGSGGRKAAIQALNTKIGKGIAPEVVARVILQAATTPRPHARYLAGRGDARALLVLKRLLPSLLFERVKRRAL